MKQDDIKNNHSYLFKTTDVVHKKDMVNTIVTVIKQKKGKVKLNYQNGLLTGQGNSPKRYLLSNGRWAKAAELQSI